MPRRQKTTTEEEPDAEKRVTRRSLRSQAATPKKEEEKKTAETPTKTPGRGRGRGRAKKNEEEEDAASEEAITPAKKGRGKAATSVSPRGRKTKKAEESGEESAGEGEEEDEPVEEVTPSKKGKGRASTSPRGRKPKAAEGEQEAEGQEAEGQEAEGQEEAGGSDAEEEATPVKKGRGKARASTSPRGGRKTKKAEEDADAAEEKEGEENTTPVKKGRGKGRASTSPRGRKAKKADSDDEGKARTAAESSRRSPRASAAAEDSTSPRRRSSRGASKAASEAIGKQVGGEQDEAEEEEEGEARGVKRKAEEEEQEKGEASEEKRQKVDESAESGETAAEEKTEEKTKEAEPGQDEEKEDGMETEEAKDEAKEEKTQEKEDSPGVEAEEQTKTSSSQETEPSTDVQAKASEEASPADTQASTEKKASDSEAGAGSEVEEAKEVTSKEGAGEEKADDAKAAEEEEAMDAGMQEEGSTVQVTEADAPAADSQEVQLVATDSLPNQTNTDPKPPTVGDTAGGSQLPNSTDLKKDDKEEEEETKSDPLFSRKYVMNSEINQSTIDSRGAFTIASYNILAECHAIRGMKEDNQYQFTTEEKLYNKHRHDRFWKELEYLDSDIYCLQEVPPQYYADVLVPAFEAKGYKGEFMKRAHVDYEEGEATFYNTKRFKAVRCQGYVLHDLAKKGMEAVGVSEDKQQQFMQAATNPGVFVLVQLECNDTGRLLNIANIHVSWEFMIRPDIQCLQIASAIKELVSQAGGDDKPHIICGDFNSTPWDPGHQLASDGNLSENNKKLLQDLDKIDLPNGQKTSMITLFEQGFQHTSKVLQSAYQVALGYNPISSCFPHDKSCLPVDYIWYSKGALKLAGVLATAESKHIQKGIPNDVFPSDHLSVKAKLAFA